MASRITQVARWVFTLNNYDEQRDYKAYFSPDEFKIKRIVWGKELAPATGTHHLQGYVEFSRSVRFVHVKRVLPTAHWLAARGTAADNFKYCTKDNNYQMLGDWTKEIEGSNGISSDASVGMIVKGLISKHAPVVRVSKEYSRKFAYFERTAKMVKQIKMKHQLFTEWDSRKLYSWQFQAFQRLMNQNQRSVLWICDAVGNVGKTFFALYLNVLYDFQLFDGVMKSRDICQLIDEAPAGFVFDVCRANAPAFDYNVLESVKNGIIMSGKYSGDCVRFKPCPVLVLANTAPEISALSLDRWDIIALGTGEFADLSKEAKFCPKDSHPRVQPPPQPILDDSFNLREYLTNELGLQTRPNDQGKIQYRYGLI